MTTSQDFVGIYEYKSTEKSENHYIVFDSIDGQLKGFYYGTQSGGEHGVSFYAVDMTNLKIHNGKIQFEIGIRKLFETTRFKIKTEDLDEPSGQDRGVLKYQGQITDDKIKLTCNSEFNDCWDSELTFDKLSNSR